MSIAAITAGVLSFISFYWLYILLLVPGGVLVAYKLRLLKKFGFYLGGIGFFFLLTGILSFGNPGLLLIGNLFVLSGIKLIWSIRLIFFYALGLVLVIGIERTRIFWEIFKTNQCCRYGILKAGFVFLLVITCEFFNSIPVVWRFYEHIPLVNWITKSRTSAELVAMSTCNYCQQKY